MQKNKLYNTVAFSLLTAGLLVGCGSDTSKGNNNTQQNHGNADSDSEGQGSNIPYLRDHHSEYKEHGGSMVPSGVKDANSMTINWTIAADTLEGATKLKEHLAFMEARLQEDKNPHAWDKLFLMEAYMKYNGYYTTSVEQANTSVVVSKQATTACAYEIISAHADAVSGDFFGKGDIKVDYSTRAESILASGACDAVRTDAENYIRQRQKTKGHGKDGDK